LNLVDVNNFDAMSIGVASPEGIRAWSFGEVKKAEMIKLRRAQARALSRFGGYEAACPLLAPVA
jgi:hypothetical protein